MTSVPNVRNLLKNERKSRRIDHPHASYTSSGILNCRICHIQLKAESLWSQHLSGSHHRTMVQQRAEQQRQASETAGRKRKADDSSDEEDEAESRKRTKPEPKDDQAIPVESSAPQSQTNLTDQDEPSIDEAEWAAFTRDVATPPPESNRTAPAVLTADATISAAPLSAEELAVRSREEANTQAKEKREAETEGEKEDAARRIEEEMEEMEGLEERVRKLRERRETLRKEHGKGDVAANVTLSERPHNLDKSSASMAVEEDEVDESEDDEEEEDELGWRFIR